MKLWTRMSGRAGLAPTAPRARPVAATEPVEALSADEAAQAAVAASVALVRRLRQGDSAALEPLYRSESPAVYRYALALCGQPDWAADAMQDAFVQFAGRPEGWDSGRGSLGAYLAGMARHALLARWRDRPLASEPAEEQADGVDSPEDQLVRAQDQAQVWAALQLLPWVFREALVLVDLQERSYVDAARIAGIELNTLRTRLHRGRARLLALLREAQAAPGAAPASAAADLPVLTKSAS